MISLDEAALRCDFLETYRIVDYRALPARQAALFACGLRDDSRIMQRISGAAVGLDTMLLAAIADAVRLLVWQNTKNGVKGRHQPVSILDTLNGGQKKDGPGFDSIEEFEAWRAGIIGGGADG